VTEPFVTEKVVRIEKLAPTGEGVARTESGVGFVGGALPGELVATNVYQVKKKFWRGRVAAVREPSAERVGGAHADCAGCDWAFFEPSAARRTKRELFRETMQRLGRLDPEAFGELPLEPSPPAYRMRARLHVAGGRVGYFAPGTHRVVPAAACEAMAPATRSLLPAVESALRESGAEASELAILEDVPGTSRVGRVTATASEEAAAKLAEGLPGFAGIRVTRSGGETLHARGAAALDVSVGSRVYRVSVDSFFQGNRHLVSPLSEAVAVEARRAPPGLALDAFGGVGLFSGALLDAGHRVVSVEAEAGAALDAARTFSRWDDGGDCEAVETSLEEFLRRDSRRFAAVVADPPRAGLGLDVARELARRADRIFVYVSCDPATLARDLPAVLEQGFAIRSAALFDLFAFTHRVEAVVSLERAA
jgi:23S rRNA (uracil1939-C5)-methyltransferase